MKKLRLKYEPMNPIKFVYNPKFPKEQRRSPEMDLTSGVTTFASWDSLIRQLEPYIQLRENEVLKGIRVESDGIAFILDFKERKVSI